MSSFLLLCICNVDFLEVLNYGFVIYFIILKGSPPPPHYSLSHLTQSHSKQLGVYYSPLLRILSVTQTHSVLGVNQAQGI